MRGNAFLYQGEELGLTQVEIAFEDLQDPEAIANWPHTLSRDGARTPMPWTAKAPWCGFSTIRPWLPVGSDHVARAVDVQEAAPDSLLHLTRQLLAFRKAHPALRWGEAKLPEAGAARLVFRRTYGDERLICLFNLGAGPVPLAQGRVENGRAAGRCRRGGAGHAAGPFGLHLAGLVNLMPFQQSLVKVGDLSISSEIAVDRLRASCETPIHI